MRGGALPWLVAAMPVFLGAATMTRVFAGGGAAPWVLGSLALYSLGNLMMIAPMRAAGMGLALSASSVIQLLAVNVVALLVFAERPRPLQALGIAFGVLAIALIAWPARGRA